MRLYQNLKKLNIIIKHKLINRHFYYLTSSLRVLPEFIVIGAAKSGTTSLYHYLSQHPCIIKSAYDELGYFDDNFNLGLNWYRSLFPTKFTQQKIEHEHKKFLTYDVTPGYFQNPSCIKRMYETLPNVKLILVLRNPVDRTYSHYQASTKRGIKTKKSFQEILDKDLKKYEEVKNDDSEYKNFILNSYIGPSIYVKLVKEWLKYFSSEQLLILSSEELKKNHKEVFSKIHNFLNIKDEEIDTVTKHNTGGDYTPLNSELRQKVIDFFKPHNEELFNIINQKFDWDK
ncbi:sulfotransferase domain-containing protein [Nitrosopumilus sp.]|jgi:hypothetical protein|nr:sulfotransferase domain-containing protein [Nitrosopumilus sp.]|tara:strand:- start:90 stop:947 length:858 start_codon:yes stop_codon:yes gene_type:complete